MSYNHFDYVPSTVNRQRSVFKYDKALARGAYMGWLYPICKPERMMPGSSLSLDLACELRSGAMVAPLMDEIVADFYSFFVPNRIVWEHWKQFVGAVDDVLFNNLQSYQIPSFRYGLKYHSLDPNKFHEDAQGNADMVNFQWNFTLACHYGLPFVGVGNELQNEANKPFINALPFRGYTFIWNLNFRPEQLVPPVVFSKSDNGATGMNIDAILYSNQISGLSFSWNSQTVYIPQPGSGGTTDTVRLGGAILPTYRVHRSLWTSCLPAPSLETLNLLADLNAPVGFINESGSSVSTAYRNVVNFSTVASGSFGALSAANSNDSGSIGPLTADLSQALLTVNNYRETIMLQNYYDVLNRAGSRYDEIIKNIFGVTTSNAVTDIPELITHKRFLIHRNQVVATATGSNATIQDGHFLGTQGAYIDTIVKDSFFTKSTTEHGYIHMLYTIRPIRIRQNRGIEPEWEELDKMDLYYPQFDGMGDVPRYKREVYYDFAYTSDSQNAILGYQEYGATWKWQRSDAVGWFDDSTPLPLKGYTLNDDQAVAPSLVITFSNMLGYVSCFSECCSFSRCLAISDPTLGPQFILDIRLTGTIAHPMPVYNIPGKGALL